jgi:acyl carrier protein
MLRSLEEIRRLLSRKAVFLSQNNRVASVNRVTCEQVREFLLARYARAIQQLGLDPATVTDDFDFLLREVIDSFGIVEMILSIEDEFHIQLDMARLDAEEITILGPLSRYVAEHGRAINISASG